MRRSSSARMILCGCLAGVLLFAGCTRPTPPPVEAPPPKVTVSVPVEREVTDYVDFTGRTDSKNSIEIRPRVTGYLTKMPFIEGAEVKKDDLLFEIDPRPYQAQVDKAAADVNLSAASLKLAQADNIRAKNVAKTNAGAISQQDLDKYQATEDQAVAQLAAMKAAMESHNLNLEFTQIKAPVDGQVGRYMLTMGNLATQDQTELTTLIVMNPMYAYFEVDENTILRIVRHLLPDSRDALRTKQVPVMMGLADEEGKFPWKGYVDFADNQLTSGTGTLSLRGVFENPVTWSGRRLLRPGMFVRIRLPIGKPHQGLLVIDKALSTDQGQKYLLIVDEKNVVQYRRVRTGALQADGLRVIEEGLKPHEAVIISGLQLVRPQMKVDPESVSMPVAVVPEEVKEPKAAPATKAEPKVEAEPVPETKAEPKAETEPVPDKKAEPKTAPESK